MKYAIVISPFRTKMVWVQYFSPMNRFSMCDYTHWKSLKSDIDVLYVLKHQQMHDVGIFNRLMYRISRLCPSFEIL